MLLMHFSLQVENNCRDFKFTVTGMVRNGLEMVKVARINLKKLDFIKKPTGTMDIPLSVLRAKEIKKRYLRLK